MTARRLTALFLSVFMLHLSFLGADLACSQHGDESARTASTSHSLHDANETPASAHAEHAQHANVTKSAQVSLQNTTSNAPCEIPSQSNCCQAFMGCSIVFSPNSEVTATASLPPRAMAIGNALRAPLSEIPAPEPPPPRA